MRVVTAIFYCVLGWLEHPEDGLLDRLWRLFFNWSHLFWRFNSSTCLHRRWKKRNLVSRVIVTSKGVSRKILGCISSSFMGKQDGVRKVLDFRVFVTFGFSRNMEGSKFLLSFSKSGARVGRVSRKFSELVFAKHLIAKGLKIFIFLSKMFSQNWKFSQVPERFPFWLVCCWIGSSSGKRGSPSRKWSDSNGAQASF